MIRPSMRTSAWNVVTYMMSTIRAAIPQLFGIGYLTMHENFKAWIAALRSGEYSQTTGVLRNDVTNTRPVGYCCLGVACDISGVGSWDESKDDRGNPAVAYDNETFELPYIVIEWLGIDDDETIMTDGVEEDWVQAVIGMNDGGASFAEIADILEERFGS